MIRSLRFYPGEWLTIAYALLTTLYLMLFFSQLGNPVLFFGIRFGVIGLILVLSVASLFWKGRALSFIRYFFPFLLLSYWYSETYYYSNLLLSNQDAFFFRADQWLFGGQPSLLFSEWIPQAWFSELMYFGYFSFYLISFGVPLWFWLTHSIHFDRVVFVVLCSFYLYYLLFIFLPVMGPQFYLRGSLADVPEGYFFSHLMRYIQGYGENPTGAFPSSHVGGAMVVLMLLFSRARRVFYYMLPLFVVLVLSTVYIKAHYLIDVFGGLLSAWLFYWAANRVYDSLRLRRVLCH